MAKRLKTSQSLKKTTAVPVLYSNIRETDNGESADNKVEYPSEEIGDTSESGIADVSNLRKRKRHYKFSGSDGDSESMQCHQNVIVIDRVTLGKIREWSAAGRLQLHHIFKSLPKPQEDVNLRYCEW
ncbi:uncharacterized protein LOC144471017 [Augochlora pura]